VRVTVILGDEDGQAFAAYCNQNGYKKSTLINHLIREHIQNSGFSVQRDLFQKKPLEGTQDAKK
jgi:hypothetical protein